MTSYRAVLGVALVLLLASSGISSTAFTTVGMDRSTSVDVVADDSGIIALATGPTSATGGVVSMTNDVLTIDFAVGSADGVNPAATFRLGAASSGDPTSEYAFSVTNLDSRAHDISLTYSLASGATDLAGSTPNLSFHVYDSSGTEVSGSPATESGNTVTLTGAAQGSTYYVVVVVDTTGFDSGGDLSGTLTVSAN